MGEDVLGQGREDGLEVGTLGSLSHCDSMCSSRRQCSTKEIPKTLRSIPRGEGWWCLEGLHCLPCLFVPRCFSRRNDLDSLSSIHDLRDFQPLHINHRPGTV